MHAVEKKTSAHDMNIYEKLVQAVSNVESDVTQSEDVNQYSRTTASIV